MTSRRIQTQFIGFWRHPVNSAKRKVFYSQHQQQSQSDDTLLYTRMIAAWRHPFSKNKRKVYVAQRKLGLERHKLLSGEVFAKWGKGKTETGNTHSKNPTYRSESMRSNFGEDFGTVDVVHSKLFDCYVNNSLGRYNPGEYVGLDRPKMSAADSDVRLIAYYLPQFHPIAENDEWWGKGFTEWRNVTRAYPHFEGHYQPRVPGELGYYDLRVVDVMRRQVELAKHYGIGAFCFHFYWFNGKRLLELPILNFLENKDINFPFCLCWANENWSRRWDGSEHELLIAQQHSAEDDVAFLTYLDKYFKDPRYLKVDGKPVLSVYRPSILPDMKETTKRWRETAKKLGYPDIYLIATNSFGFVDYKSYDFDALSEFPPHHVKAANIQNEFMLSEFRTGWRIRSYNEIVESELQRKPLAGIVHPGIMPSWDNSARRPANGEIIHESSPALFHKWLEHAIELAAKNPPEQRLVFINAWNEWAEGAYLEPDARYGYAYLNACASALSQYISKKTVHQTGNVWNSKAKTVLLCTHHAGKRIYGGERSLLDVMRALHHAGFNVVVTAQESSNTEYIAELRRWAQVVRILPYHQWTKDPQASTESVPKFLELCDEFQPDLVYVNTIVVKAPLIAAKLKGVPSIVHAREVILHDVELAEQIGKRPTEIVAEVVRTTDHIIANSNVTAACFSTDGHTTTIYNIIAADQFDLPNTLESHIVRFGLISSNLGKKGIEDVIELARLCEQAEPRARFLIIGPTSRPICQQYISGSKKEGCPSNVEFVDYKSSPQEALQLVNVVLNFSHFQESFGRTILEAMAASRPVIVYDWGALPELVRHGETGFIIPHRRPDMAIEWVKLLCDYPSKIRQLGAHARERADAKFGFPEFAQKIAAVCNQVASQRQTASERYSAVLAQRVRSQDETHIDIVICVHNALSDVSACLTSVQKYLGRSHKLIIVDDASEPETRDYLNEFVKRLPGTILWRNDVAVGYTRAANKGLELSSGDLVILLNSDTVVTKFWAEKMADAVFSVKGGGLVGPMSNAASFQSLPNIAGTKSQTAVNQLPEWVTPEDMNHYCEEWSSTAAPVVPLVHGFCFGIAREVIDTIGGFDEKAFPEGYGEENDYCIRAMDAGFSLVLATHTYVFHAKSKSYTEERRHSLAERSQEVLYSRHGRDRFLAACEYLEKHPQLGKLRNFAVELYSTGRANTSKGAAAERVTAAGPRALSTWSDKQWLDCLQSSVDCRVVKNVRLPGFPDVNMQTGSVGSAGKGALQEAFKFYLYVRAAARDAGLPLAQTSRVLDFGVGWGRIIRCFLRDVSPSGLHGVDVSERFLDAVRSTEVPGDFRLIQPAGKLPFEDNFFDVVFSYSVFTHLPEELQDNWLREIRRVLKPGGIMVATVEPVRFVEFIEELSKAENIASQWHRELVAALKAKPNASVLLKEKGFVFLETNNGKTYGDTIMTEGYVGRHWGQFFNVKSYLDDPIQFKQAVVFCTKPT